MTKPLTPTLALCLAGSAVMVGALFAAPDDPETKGYDETTPSQSAEPSPTPTTPSLIGPTSPTTTTEPAQPLVPTPQSTASATPSATPSTQPSGTPTATPTPTPTPTTSSTTSTPSSPTSTPTTTDTTTPDGPGTGGGGDGGPVDPPPKIVITDMTIPTLRVEPGEEVRVVNEDDVPHRVTEEDGDFTTGNIPAGATRIFVAPEDTGDYTVYCEYHQDMTGTLRVRD